MIYTAEHFQGDLQLQADLCVIGSGAGGSPVAYEAAKKGKRVVVLEAGRFWRPKDFTQLEHEMFPRLYHDNGGRTTSDKAIHVHQGKGVGGSTLHNINLCARIPSAVETRWRQQHTFRHLSSTQLDGLYKEIEAHISVSQLQPTQLNSNNALLKRGMEALKYRGGYLHHNRVGCAGSGFCELGCPFDAKQNALKSFLTPAVEAGAMILADTWAWRLRYNQRKITHVDAVVRHPTTGKALHRVTIEAKAVCSSASATGTPTLLQRSFVPDPKRLVGSRLFLHPGVAVAGLFQETLNGWRGIPQSYECTEFLDFHEGSKKRMWIIPAFAHPVGVSSILSGFGEEHARYLRHYTKMAAFTAMLHDESPGSVRKDGKFGVQMNYWPDAKDQAQLLLGLRECARLMLAAGAQQAVVPFAKTLIIEKTEDIDPIFRRLSLRKHDLNITAVHPMGTVWMGDDPNHACVDSSGRYHHLDNLFISDTSLFPTSIGVAPQLTTYTFGLHIGRQITTLL